MDDLFGPPPRNMGSGKPYLSAGARKEKLRQRSYRAATTSTRAAPYAELRAASAFSFLDGSSLPEDLVARAAELDLPAVALVDRNGVYGAPRFYKAAKAAGIKALVGADLTLEEGTLTLLVASPTGYKNLCRLITAAAHGRQKGSPRADWRQVEQYSPGLHVLARSTDPARLDRLSALFPGRLHLELQRHSTRAGEWRNRRLVELGERLRLPLVATNGARYARPADKSLYDVMTCIREHLPIDRAGALLDENRERHLKSGEEMTRLFADLPGALAASWDLAGRLEFTLENLGYRFPDYPLPPGETASSYLRQLAWNGARARFRPLTARAQAQIQKELALIEKLDLAGYFLIVWDIVRFCQEERILVQGRGSAANSAVCYALSITAVDPVKMELLFERFLSEERGEWPDIDLDLPSGDQREKVIQYVYRRYGIDAYGGGAGMTANVITYRDRSAAREVAKALGYSAEQVDRLSKQLGAFHYDLVRGDPKSLQAELAAAGFDPADSRVGLFGEMWQRLQNLPRHLGQHSGGMVMAAGRLDEVVPLEPAAMPGRTVVQWDKDDCADLGIIKVDLLGLGMLQAIEEMIPLIRTHERVEVDLAHLPQDDPRVFKMLREADTVGVFQVESRAQMASLPRNAPTRFYDLVVQVAIIRPGPIMGGMIHPFFERRLGRETVDYLHPCLEPILKRTLGVPIFQEQILRMAMVAAGFSGGEAEELRRAMGFKRSVEKMQTIETRLRTGMAERGITGKVQDQVVQSITSFALYGFPESHAASFALIAYASAWLRCYHPTAFYVALLNAWPMGFYHPATLIKDAERHGVEARAVDVNHSRWRCTWEPCAPGAREREIESSSTPPLTTLPPSQVGTRGPRRSTPARNDAAAQPPPPRRGGRAEANGFEEDSISPLRARSAQDVQAAGALRIGLRYVRGLRQSSGEAIERARVAGPFVSAEDLQRRCGLRADELTTLAEAGALGSLGLTRRAALWQVAQASRPSGPLFAGRGGGAGRAARSPLPEMTRIEEIAADYSTTEITTGPHPVAYVRGALARHGIVAARDLGRLPAGKRVRTAGSVIVRQRPGTAKGMLFLTLEDETGMSQAIVTPDLMRENRKTIVGSPGLVVEGILQHRDGSISVRAEKFWPLAQVVAAPSHDFR